MRDYDWLNNIKVGDKVIVYSSSGYSNNELRKVVKVTPAQIHTYVREDFTNKFWKKNGELVGSRDSWNITRVLQVTDELKAKIEEDTKRAKLLNRVRNQSWKELTTEVLVTVVGIIDNNDNLKEQPGILP